MPIGCEVHWNLTLSLHNYSPQMLRSPLLLFLSLHLVFTKSVTTIIDDAFAGDARTSISYSPSNAWAGVGSVTTHGRVAPDASQALDGTWHDTTDDTDPRLDGTTMTFMEISFQGKNVVNILDCMAYTQTS